MGVDDEETRGFVVEELAYITILWKWYTLV